MKLLLAGAAILLMNQVLVAGTPVEGTVQVRTESLSSLLDEALVHNPEIQSAIHEMGRTSFAARQKGTLDDPMLVYMREEMPGFRWNEPAMHKIEFLQAIRFPTKLGSEREIAELDAEHAHHVHLETVNLVLKQVKVAYYDLWFAQESIRLNIESARLLSQFTEIALTKYQVGERGQEDVLKASVEAARVENELLGLVQMEQTAKSMLMALVNRTASDTVGGVQSIGPIAELLPLDNLQKMALRNRPMLIHDSLTVLQRELATSLASAEYLPDLILGVEYVKRPDLNRDAWSVKAGISLPFFPWTLGKASGRVEEAEAEVRKSRSLFLNSRNMVAAAIEEQYQKAESARKRVLGYERSLLPQSRQAFEVTLVAYQTGRTDFLALIDAYRTLIDLTEERLAVRRELETAMAELQRAVGLEQIMAQNTER